MLTFLKRLFGLEKFKFICACGSVIEARTPWRKGKVIVRRCDEMPSCGRRWEFEWKGDHFDIRCDPPLHDRATGADVNVQTPEAVADFIAKRNSGAFGAKNEAEFQEMLKMAAEEDALEFNDSLGG